MFKYSMSIQWSDEDEGFIATVPELEGLSAFGETQEEATRQLLEAAEAFVETMKKAGDALPEPSKVAVYSGQTRLRMPKGLHARLASEAGREGVSLNTYLVSLLSERQAIREAVKGVRESARLWLPRWTQACSLVQNPWTPSHDFKLFEDVNNAIPVGGKPTGGAFFIKEEVN